MLLQRAIRSAVPALAAVAVGVGLAPAALAEAPPPPPPTTGWSGTVCGTVLPVPLNVARDVDDAGIVVGYDARVRAASWNSRTGAYRWFGGIGGGLPSEISAVSGAGRVAGVATIDGPSLDPSKAVRVEGPLPLRPIDRSQRTHDQVYDVNDGNVVVGTSEIIGGQGATEAFVWTDRRRVLAPPSSTFLWPRALSVNEAGWVLGTGYRTDAQGFVAYRVLVWRPDGSVIELPPLPGDDVFIVNHIDEAGRVIGHRAADNAVGEAVGIWSPITGYTFAPSPGGDVQVLAADDRGGAVGVVRDLVTRASTPFLYRPDEGYRRLTGPDGAPLTGLPYRMSEAGQVLVQHRGRPHLWTGCTGVPS